jgi:hypothetical protein
MSDDLVTRTENVLEGVTEGPWEVVWETEEGEYGGGAQYAYAIYGPADRATLDSDGCSDDYKERYGHQITEIVGLSDADAEFFADSRQLVPELLAEVKMLRRAMGTIKRKAEIGDSQTSIPSDERMMGAANNRFKTILNIIKGVENHEYH